MAVHPWVDASDFRYMFERNFNYSKPGFRAQHSSILSWFGIGDIVMLSEYCEGWYEYHSYICNNSSDLDQDGQIEWDEIYVCAHTKNRKNSLLPPINPDPDYFAFFYNRGFKDPYTEPGRDDDDDGVWMQYENPDANADGDFSDAADSDQDSTPDYLDDDDDNDEISTSYENPDPNQNHSPSDALDSDLDFIPDYLDNDDDGDGILTANENPDPNGDGNPSDAVDSNQNGIPDYLDPGGQPAINISNSPGTASVIPKVIRVPNSQTVLVTWIEQTVNESIIRLSRSDNNGITWSIVSGQVSAPGQVLSGDWANDFNCYAIDYSGYAIHIVYQFRANAGEDFEIVYARSTNGGSLWDYRTITTNAADSLYPDVTAQGEYVHITYQDSWPGNPDIMYKRINSYGMGSIDQSRRLTSSATDSLYPRIAVSADGSIVNVVYEEDVPNTNHHIFLTTIRDYGSGTFSSQRLTWGTDWNGLPDIEASTGAETEYFYIVYNTLKHGNREIMYKRLDNWCIPPFDTYTVRLTYSDTESYCNSIAFDGTYNNIHITYHDSLPGNNEVYYRKFSDYGGGVYTGKRISWTAGDSINAAVASRGVFACIVWSDNTSGNYEIYWKYVY